MSSLQSQSPLVTQSYVELAGERRLLCPDLNMAAVLHERVGAHWLLWLAERWLGKPVKVDGRMALHIETPKPEELALVLFALLQTDREISAERGAIRDETEASVRRSVTLATLQPIQAAVVKALLSCFMTPGEAAEFDVRAAAATPGSEAAPQPGSGQESSQ